MPEERTGITKGLLYSFRFEGMENYGNRLSFITGLISLLIIFVSELLAVRFPESLRAAALQCFQPGPVLGLDAEIDDPDFMRLHFQRERVPEFAGAWQSFRTSLNWRADMKRLAARQKSD